MKETMEQREAKIRLEFAIYCIEIVAAHLDCSKREVYRRLARVNLMKEFIIDCYDTLHTQSGEYVAEDVVAALNTRENRICGIGEPLC